MNLDQLQAFLDVVELGSFSAAAARRNLTQPAVSLQVKTLEQQLGVRLVERVGRRMRATSAGQALYQRSGAIDEAVAAALDAVSDHQEGVVGRVTIGTGATACIYLLPPILRELKQRCPRLEIIVRTGNTIDILRMLEENVLDVAIVTLPAPGRAFDVTPLLDDEQVAIFPKARAADAETLKASEITRQNLILYEQGGHTRRVIDEWFERSGLTCKPMMELGSIEAIKKLVGAGLGYAIVPHLAASDLPRDGQVAVASLEPKLHRTLGLVLRRDKRPDRCLREVLNALRGAVPNQVA
jgi:DNA-binding transcriptional LysR family regulator